MRSFPNVNDDYILMNWFIGYSLCTNVKLLKTTLPPNANLH